MHCPRQALLARRTHRCLQNPILLGRGFALVGVEGDGLAVAAADDDDDLSQQQTYRHVVVADCRRANDFLLVLRWIGAAGRTRICLGYREFVGLESRRAVEKMGAIASVAGTDGLACSRRGCVRHWDRQERQVANLLYRGCRLMYDDGQDWDQRMSCPAPVLRLKPGGVVGGWGYEVDVH